MNREKESNFVSAVVYLHDNAEQVSPFLERVYNDVEQHFKQFEIIRSMTPPVTAVWKRSGVSCPRRAEPCR